MRPILATAAIALSLSLSACGQGEENRTASGATVAAVAPPAGTSWSETVSQTPEGGFVMGNPNAAIKLVEFASYTCPHCKEFMAEADEELKRDFVETGKVSFELRNYVRDPLDLATALLARCGGAEPFFPLNNQFFANQDAMFNAIQSKGEAPYQAAVTAPAERRFVAVAELAGLIDFAKQRGLAEPQARQCLADAKAVDTLTKGVEQANKDHNIQGTPSFLINGKVVDGVSGWGSLREKLKEAGA